LLFSIDVSPLFSNLVRNIFIPFIRHGRTIRHSVKTQISLSFSVIGREAQAKGRKKPTSPQ
ncbi:MAG: hypothetical protein ACLUN9_08860, partial [Enterocloster aldenensis]